MFRTHIPRIHVHTVPCIFTCLHGFTFTSTFWNAQSDLFTWKHEPASNDAPEIIAKLSTVAIARLLRRVISMDLGIIGINLIHPYIFQSNYPILYLTVYDLTISSYILNYITVYNSSMLIMLTHLSIIWPWVNTLNVTKLAFVGMFTCAFVGCLLLTHSHTQFRYALYHC